MRRYYNFTGAASPTGFEIEIIDLPDKKDMPRRGSVVRDATPGHDLEKTFFPSVLDSGNPWLIAGLLFLVISGVGAYWTAIWAVAAKYDIALWWFSPLLIISPLLLSMTAHSLVTGLCFSRNLRHKKWHGCEHKLIELYDKGLTRTREALLSARRTTPYCGTVPVFIWWLWMLAFIPALPLALLGTVGMGVGLALAVLLLLFSWPLTLWLQGVLATAEPDEDQIEAALELAQRIDAALQQPQASQ